MVEEALRTDPRYANIVATGSDAQGLLFEVLDEADRKLHDRCWNLISDIIAHAPLRYKPGQERAFKVSASLVCSRMHASACECAPVDLCMHACAEEYARMCVRVHTCTHA